MKVERDFLVQTLKDAGVKGKIHESMKSLKNCNEIHVGAVLRIGEKFSRSGSKKKYTDQEGQRKQRKRESFSMRMKMEMKRMDSDFWTSLMERMTNSQGWRLVRESEINWRKGNTWISERQCRTYHLKMEYSLTRSVWRNRIPKKNITSNYQQMKWRWKRNDR